VAGRDGFVDYPLSIPAELRSLVVLYQNRMKITSFNQTIRTLLETHPGIDKLAQEMYARVITSDREEQPG
jgi:hypothetical protein